MDLTEQQRAACAALEDSWYWQVQERGKWRYRWHNEVMVRYYECAPLEADVFPAMIEYLQGQTGITSIQLHGKRIELGGEWKAVRAWYETRDGDTSETNKLKRVRICQALVKNTVEAGGDGPYLVENGCMYKVKHTFHWNVDALPSLPESSSGVNYQIQGVTRDDETGLWNCVVEKRERQRQDIAEYTTEKTVFETKKEEQHLGVKQGSVAGTGKAASVSGGKMVTRKLRKNEDCTTDVMNETVQEEAAEGAVTETEARLRGTVETTVNRNMASKANESGMEPGESVRNEKTPGGRWNQTIRKVKAAAAGMLRFVCEKTVFRHTHTKVTNVKENPGESHVEQAGGGVIREREVQRTEEGTYDVTDKVTTDVPAPAAVTETSVVLDGKIERTVNRNMPSKAIESGLGIGDRVTNERTESGLWNQTIEVATPEAVGTIEETCEQTALVHTHAETEGTGGGEKPEAEALAGGDGVVVVRRVRKTERGAWNVTDETRTAKQKEGNLGTSGSEGRVVETTVLRNQNGIGVGPGSANEETEISGSINEFGLIDGTVRRVQHVEARKKGTGGSKGRTVEVESAINSLEAPDDGEKSANVEIDVSVSPNEHGSMSWTKRKVTYEKEKATAEAKNPVVSSKETVTINDEDTDPQDTAERGEVVDISVSPNDHGTATVRKVRRTAKPKKEEKEWETDDGNYVAHHKLIVFRNQEEIPQIPNKAYQMSVSMSINEFGLLDGVISGVTSREGSSGGAGNGSQADNRFTVFAYYTFRRANGKYYRQMFRSECRYLRSTIDNMVAESSGGESEPMVGWISGVKGSYALIYNNITKIGSPQEYLA